MAHVGTCRECDSALAHDQRWCIECGARRGPMSDAMRALIDGVIAADPPPSLIEPHVAPRFALPAPRAAAVAIAALLAFGVMLGSFVSPAAESAAQAPIVVAVAGAPAAAPVTPAPAAAPDHAVGDSAVVDDAPAEAPVPPAEPTTESAPEPAVPAPAPPKPLPVPPLPPLPSVSHVFVVMLSGHGYEAAFGPDSKATYLSKTLTTHGELIPNYYAVTHGGLANEVALLSGQGPDPQTASNCPKYTDVSPGTVGDKDQATGDGCVYPPDTKTLADQLFLGGESWKAYVEGLGGGAGKCDRPDAGADDPNHDPRPDSAYVTWRNPFLYFHSLVDSPACGTGMADLSQLATDLQQVGDTPALSYIVPDRCHDGSDTQCAPDQPTGLAAADAWLQTVIPGIEASPGYKQGGLIAITFDAAPQDGPEADSSSCCGQPDQFPNLPPDDPSQPSGGGGGKVGLLLISPYIKPGTVNATGSYNHFSLFASIEDLFTLGHIAYANLPDLTTFDKTVYTAYQGSDAG